MVSKRKPNHVPKRVNASGSRQRNSDAEAKDQLVYELEAERTRAAREIERLEDIRQRLEWSRANLAAIYEKLPVGYVTLDQRGHIHDANAKFRDMLGFSRERLLHLTLSFLVCREDLDILVEHLNRCEATTEPTIVSEVRLLTRRRQTVPVRLISVRFGIFNNRKIFLTAVVDLTEALRSQQALADSKEFAEAIVQTVRQPLAVLDPELRIISCNRAFSDLFKRPSDYLRGRAFEVLLNLWWSGNELRHQLERVLVKNEPLDNLQLRINPPEVGEHILLLSARRLYQKGSPSQRILVALEDVTDREQARAELRATNEALEERVALRTEALRRSYEQMESFCYSIAHDLRSPLRSMTGFSKILSDQFGEKIGAEGRAFTDRIARSAERMDRLIQDLLQYGRLNTIELPMQDVDLDRVFNDVLFQLEKDIEDRHARIRKEQTLPIVRGNHVVLHVVLLNLLNNAMKFVPPTVVPEVSVRWDRARSRLWIKDNGIGIAPENHARIFGVFQRLHAEDAYSGTGIGLALVSKGIERMGGRVGLESELGKGSRFWVELKPVNGTPPPPAKLNRPRDQIVAASDS